MKPETLLQNRCVEAGRRMGAEIFVIGSGAMRKRINTDGTPDTFVYTGTGFWIGVEIKTLDGRLSPEQTRLQQEGKIRVARSLDEFVRVVDEALTRIRRRAQHEQREEP